MAERKPWFLVMTPDDANRPGSSWRGAASQASLRSLRTLGCVRGKVSVLPIALEGWIALVLFVLVLIGALAGIWIRGYGAGALSLANALVLTVIATTIIVLAFIWVVRVTMTRLPPAGS